LLSELHVDLLLDPLPVVGRVHVVAGVQAEAGHVLERVEEVEQLRDVVGDGGGVGVHLLEVLLEDLAESIHEALCGIEVRVSASVCILGALDQQDNVLVTHGCSLPSF